MRPERKSLEGVETLVITTVGKSHLIHLGAELWVVV